MVKSGYNPPHVVKEGRGLQNNNSVRITLTKSGYNPPSVVNKGRGLQNNNSVRITLTMT